MSSIKKQLELYTVTLIVLELVHGAEAWLRRAAKTSQFSCETLDHSLTLNIDSMLTGRKYVVSDGAPTTRLCWLQAATTTS